ncbi:chemotaxis protein CheW [Candidatus Reidiella endopervernicosa]|uniref:Chemotaxis protein CheW n=1 Tax=Candidatus Reidiella endopervernicosa TaxID=2738883 RepID=A0A6N0HRJ7_9GAMM|nr:chemotaxis protein CheW [Candidatus Reidiella endopervernicosa]QKQ24880.1 chemotaxis protein CheW [Candidatus Reidiella endopervernicosa]
MLGLGCPKQTFAKIATPRSFIAGEGYPDWLLGTVMWRSLALPLVSMEVVLGQEAPEVDARSRIAVVNTLYQKQGMPFFAVLTQGIPRLVRASLDNLSPADSGGKQMVSAEVTLDGESAVIPNLEQLEAAIKESGIDVKFVRPP